MNKKLWGAGEPDEPAEKLTPVIVDYIIKDHHGNVYTTFSDMCSAYEKGVDSVRYRLQCGWRLEDALEIPLDVHNRPKKFACTDHTGRYFGSISEMCTAYGITRTLYIYRIKKGLTQEEALTAPVNNTNKAGRKYKALA